MPGTGRIQPWRGERKLAQPQHFPLDGRFQELCGIGDTNFLHHIRPVCLDRFDADAQPMGDFLVFETGPDQFENFLLARRQGFGASFARWNDDFGRSGSCSALAWGRHRHIRRTPLRVRVNQPAAAILGRLADYTQIFGPL